MNEVLAMKIKLLVAVHELGTNLPPISAFPRWLDCLTIDHDISLLVIFLHFRPLKVFFKLLGGKNLGCHNYG